MTSQKEVRPILSMLPRSSVSSSRRSKSPPNKTLTEDVPSQLNEVQEASFKGINEILSMRHPLSHYDLRQVVKVAADVSQSGVGDMLLSRRTDGNEKAAFHVPKSLTSSRRDYFEFGRKEFALVEHAAKHSR